MKKRGELMDILLIIYIVFFSISIFLLAYYTSGRKTINNIEIKREKLLLKEHLKGDKRNNGRH